MGGVRRNKKRRNNADEYHTRGPGAGYKDIVRENKLFEDFYRRQNLCADDSEFQEMMGSLKTDLPSSFRITGFRSQVRGSQSQIGGRFVGIRRKIRSTVDT